jgi:hypothetical protein
MASGTMRRIKQVGHMAAPTSNAKLRIALANGGPSTQGGKQTFSYPVLTDQPLTAWKGSTFAPRRKASERSLHHCDMRTRSS